MEEFRDGPRSLSVVSATRALSWSSAHGFALRCGDEAITRTILPSERLTVVVNSVGDQDPALRRVRVDDPCGGEEPHGDDDLSLPACGTMRQVVVTLECGRSSPIALGLQLVRSGPQATGGPGS